MEAAKITHSAFSKQAIDAELSSISSWWMTHGPDRQNGGFLGEIDYFAQPVEDSDKGCVLNTRILWFFSELYQQSGQVEHLTIATQCYQWLTEHLLDRQYGGLVWSTDAKGQYKDSKKQTYAQCFGIYALSAYYQATANEQALELALACFSLVEQHAKDPVHGGYVEACDRQWQEIHDHRLSDKDLNYPKSMNTHLHVLEAYAALYKVNPIEPVEKALRHVLQMFTQHIICPRTAHLKLFFDMQWQDKSQTYSFGHDIEASWLLWEAALILGDERVKSTIKKLIVRMAQVCLCEAVGDKGQVCDDFTFESNHRDERSYWWVQAEAMVGFLNAYHLTADVSYLQACRSIWHFIQDYHIDERHGEWHWLASCDQDRSEFIYKAGFWKGPYHNGRAMLELLRLFELTGE